MKPKSLCLLFLLLYLGSYASSRELNCGLDTLKYQKAKPVKKLATRKLTIQELAKMHKPWFDNCTFTSKYTLAGRLQKYPFSKAAKILAVSYLTPEPVDDAIILNNGDTLKSAQRTEKKQRPRGLEIIKDSLNYSTLIEVKTLNQDQIGQLTNIIYNTDYQKKIGINTMAEGGCFDPRNAIVFLDKNGKVYDYLEICFACQNYSSLSQRLNIGKICTQKYDMLRKYFISVGVIYGTKKNMKGD